MFVYHVARISYNLQFHISDWIFQRQSHTSNYQTLLYWWASLLEKNTLVLQLTENKSTNMFIHANVVLTNDKIFRLTSLAAVMQWSWMVVRDVSTSS